MPAQTMNLAVLDQLSTFNLAYLNDTVAVHVGHITLELVHFVPRQYGEGVQVQTFQLGNAECCIGLGRSIAAQIRLY